MLGKIISSIRYYLLISVQKEYKAEFSDSINKINFGRGKVTAAAFIFMEIIQLIATIILKSAEAFSKPYIYYESMYILMICAMVVFLLVFIKVSKNMPEYKKEISVLKIIFPLFILSWCAGISLLDQRFYGQIIVYTVALFAVSVTPIYEPILLLLIYFAVHIVFIMLLPNFQTSTLMQFGIFINSVGFILICWAISYMRYKRHIHYFYDSKTLEKNSEELKRLNQELKEANLKLEKLSNTDGLTGISNRLLFDKTLNAEWGRCRRHFMPLSLVMVDIDYFKAYNDSYGHLAGDECLKKIAKAMSSNVRRSSDVVARYGGEEFAIILPYMKKDDAIEFAEQLRIAVEALQIPHISSTISDYITISLGVHTVVPSGSSSAEQLIRLADKALYEAKMLRNNIAYA
ncbi:MAG: GGDEF domain-containing protein [Solirubrobacterales bacterium]